jgi:hypothetical protein
MDMGVEFWIWSIPQKAHVLKAWSPASGTVERRLGMRALPTRMDQSIDKFIAEWAIRRCGLLGGSGSLGGLSL